MVLAYFSGLEPILEKNMTAAIFSGTLGYLSHKIVIRSLVFIEETRRLHLEIIRNVIFPRKFKYTGNFPRHEKNLIQHCQITFSDNS